MSKKFNKVMHFNDIENAYTNHQYPDAECMLTDTNDVPDSLFTVDGVKLIPKKVTENGTYYASQDGANGYDEVIVDVESGATPVLRPLVCSYNGTFTPPEGVDGFDVVTTNIHPANPYVGNFTSNQTIHVDGEYNGVDITVDVPPVPVGTNIKYLCYAKFEGADTGAIDTNFPLTVKEYDGYDDYLSYDSTNNCLTVLTDFQAILVPWVVNYQTGVHPAFVGLKLNNDWVIHRMASPSKEINSLGCISNSYSVLDGRSVTYLADLDECTNGVYISLHTGDTLSLQKPIDYGFVHCYLKVYKLFDSNSTSDTFMSSVVNTTDTDTYLNQIVGGNIRLDNRTFTANGTYAPVHEGYKNVTVAVPPTHNPYNATNLLVADEGGQYITNDLEIALVAGKVYVGEINDVSSSELVPFLFTRDSNTSQIITLRLANEIAYLTLTNTTASLSNYAGSYRKVYLRLSEVVDGQLY